jgi:hypothetical protein
MALKLGAYTACLHDRQLAEALEVLKSNGLTSVEVNTGGFIPSPHCHVDLLLSSEQARRDYLAEFSSRGAAKDPMIARVVAIRGVLDTSFEQMPADVKGKVPAAVGPSLAVNVEPEDANHSRLDGLALAVRNLRAAAAKM